MTFQQEFSYSTSGPSMRSGGLVATASSGPVQVFNNFFDFFFDKICFLIPYFFRASPPPRSRSSSRAWMTRFVFLPISIFINLNPSSFPFCIEFALMLKLFQEWQSSLYSLLQNQTFNQVEVDLFELMCKVLDQNLFAQVDWARNSYYFKELKVGTNFRAKKRNEAQ